METTEISFQGNNSFLNIFPPFSGALTSLGPTPRDLQVCHA